MSGAEVLSPDYLRMLHLIAQAVLDWGRTLSWIRARRDQPIGLHGISLGGCVAALVAAFEPGAGVCDRGHPAGGLPGASRTTTSPGITRRYSDEFEVDQRLVRAVSRVVSPLAFAPRVPRERRFIYAGIADRVVKPYQPRALWRHSEEPEIHWFSGGHVLGIWNETLIGDFLVQALETSGLVRD